MTLPEARWVIMGELETVSAAHIGGGDGEAADQTIIVDRLSGQPLLAGSTVAGLLRHHLRTCDQGYGRPEPAISASSPGIGAAEQLFGATRSNTVGTQSPVITFDALGQLADHIAIRDAVAIERATGTAADHKKYDYEVLAPGTRFPLRVDLVVGAAPTPDVPDAGHRWGEAQLLGWLARALDGFQQGHITLGARGSRGLGRVEVKHWKARRFDLTTADGWLAWAGSDHVDPVESVACSPAPSVLDVLAPMWPDPDSPLELLGADPRPFIEVTLELQHEEPILIGAPGTGRDSPDTVHLESGGAAVLSGSAVTGALRHQAWRIAELVHGGADQADRLVDALFGPELRAARPEVDTSPPGATAGMVGPAPPAKLKQRRSALSVSEHPIVGGRSEWRTRVALDRFTGGSFPGRLFDQQPHVGGTSMVTLSLNVPPSSAVAPEALAGLVVLVCRDVTDGLVAFGGGESVGYGHTTGTARLIGAGGFVGDLDSPEAVELVKQFCAWERVG